MIRTEAVAEIPLRFYSFHLCSQYYYSLMPPGREGVIDRDRSPCRWESAEEASCVDDRYQVQRVHQTDGREDRFPFTLTINTGPTDSTTHMFSAESEVQQTMWIECFQQVGPVLGPRTRVNPGELTSPGELSSAARGGCLQATRQLGTGGGIRTSFGRAGGGAPVKTLSRSKSDRAAAAAAARRSGGGLISDEPLVELKLHRGQFGFGVPPLHAPRHRSSAGRACHAPPSADLSVSLFLARGCDVAGVNVSEVAVVLDVRDSAKHCGMRKGHIISKINGAPRPSPPSPRALIIAMLLRRRG
jgi:hypothetical protein